MPSMVMSFGKAVLAYWAAHILSGIESTFLLFTLLKLGAILFGLFHGGLFLFPFLGFVACSLYYLVHPRKSLMRYIETTRFLHPATNRPTTRSRKENEYSVTSEFHTPPAIGNELDGAFCPTDRPD